MNAYYGPTFYPDDRKTARERVAWARTHFESMVDHPRFRMFFAVHEVESWFLIPDRMVARESSPWQTEDLGRSSVEWDASRPWGDQKGESRS